MRFNSLVRAIPTEPYSSRTAGALRHAMSRYLEEGGFPDVQCDDFRVRVKTLQGYVDAVMIGVNNGAKNPEGTVAGVKKIVGEIRAKHPESKVLLMAILPHGKRPRETVQAKVVNPTLKAFAAESGCTWLDMGEKFLDEKG